MTARVAKKVVRLHWNWWLRTAPIRGTTRYRAFVKHTHCMWRSEKPTPGLRWGRWDAGDPQDPATATPF